MEMSVSWHRESVIRVSPTHACPGRDADYHCNSQVPCNEHNGRHVFYVIGRCPARPDGDRYPILDLVICYESFLNADSTYVHQDK